MGKRTKYDYDFGNGGLKKYCLDLTLLVQYLQKGIQKRNRQLWLKTHKAYEAPVLASLPYGFFLGFSTGFFLPAAFSAWSMINSSCPLTLRNSSAAHFSSALYISSSILRTKLFLSATMQLL